MPPVTLGAVNVTLTSALPGVAMPMLGAFGTVAGVTLLEAAEGTLLPTALLASTVQVTGVPFVKPLTTMGDAVPVWLCAPQLAV